jgi:hypothetical protein
MTISVATVYSVQRVDEVLFWHLLRGSKETRVKLQSCKAGVRFLNIKADRSYAVNIRLLQR